MKLKQSIMQAEFLRYQNPKSEKEAQIVSAAERVFAERGFDGATTAELARHAKVTERTLFKYFPGKADLYRRVLAGLLYSAIVPGHMRDLKERMLERGPRFREWYTAILMARYQAIAAEPFRLKLLWGALLYSPDFAELFGKLWRENLNDTAVAAMRHFQEMKQVRSDIDAEAMVRAAFSLGAGFLLTRFVFAPGMPRHAESEIRELVEIYAKGVETGESAATRENN
ncbi:MAG: TetR/AcrR family transcriptional regulator [Turneriella sp.]|nr:TetR/AcrR family transcriptional regulator [Turneriella sp.]